LAFSLLGTIPAKNELSFNAEIDLCLDTLTNYQFLEPQLAQLRSYASPQPARRMGDRGENFAGLVKAICQKPKQHFAFVSWLRELSPLELDDVTILTGAVGEPLFALRESGRLFPAHILSDGTLRFAALAAAFFQPEPPRLLYLEEIENAIHPTRLRVLVEMLKQFSRRGGPQLIATSHSPVVLSWLRTEDYPHTFLCRRRSEDGASEVRPLPSLPNFARLVQLQQLDEFYIEGGMEAVL
jgi:predicted ATPase